MLKHGHSKSDVNQGEVFFFIKSTGHFPSEGDLADCWFVAPMTAFSEKADLFEVAIFDSYTMQHWNIDRHLGVYKKS